MLGDGGSKIKRARLIYNPTSGREEMNKRLPEILRILEKGGLETSCHATEGLGDATMAAKSASERGFDVIIAAGGDGTLNEVVNGLAECEYRPPLGILPLGTTNDFARALNIPKSPLEAAQWVVEGNKKALDIGRMNRRYFLNIAAGGSLTELTYEVPSRLKTMIGQLAYYMKGLEKLPRLKPIDIELIGDKFHLREKVMIFLICNSNSVGGFEKLVPQADLSDGLFDVILLRKTNLADFIRVVTLATRGEHLTHPNVMHFKTNKLEVRCADHVQINLDGELGGELPSEFAILPKHIEVFVKPEYRLITRA